ncbi:MAG: hypothetical protein WC668_00120 [Patescibacteria group bacterium]|jgi:hypothetical protein
MLALVLQAAGTMPDAAQLQELQRQAMQAAQAAQIPTGAGAMMGGGLGAMVGAMAIFGVVFLIVGIVLAVLSLINIYHWGMTDKAAFIAVNEEKKKWFYILVLVPIVCSLVAIIPILGWLISLIGGIYWVVMTLVYFFGLRTKIK